MTGTRRLLDIMARLRDPKTGCPWDTEQTFASIAPYTIEEAYEVADTIERNALDELKGELGDLLFQVVFHARMAEEQGLFEFADVVSSISDKLERRHPHVFADAANQSRAVDTAAEQTLAWEQLKEQERQQVIADTSILSGIAVALPGLTRAVKLTQRASRVGFDWPNIMDVFDKIEEETEEIRQEVKAQSGHDRLEDEIGDLYFAVSNLARHANVDPESAIRRANNKFENRFRWIESQLANNGSTVQETSLDELDYLWEQSKRRDATESNVN